MVQTTRMMRPIIIIPLIIELLIMISSTSNHSLPHVSAFTLITSPQQQQQQQYHSSTKTTPLQHLFSYSNANGVASFEHPQQIQQDIIRSSNQITKTSHNMNHNNDIILNGFHHWTRLVVTIVLGISLQLILPNMAIAENELSAKYGNSGFDTSLVDQTCLLDHCSLQAKACLQDDPNCRKGLTCTAKCLGDNACITGCMARYGDTQLDSLLKCTIEDHECIKVAILPGGNDMYGQEPRAPSPTITNFDIQSMQGSWYKVIGYNPNYDCYACQRNTFMSGNDNTLQMDVEFSMPHLLPDGSPLPPSGVKETFSSIYNDDGTAAAVPTGLKSMALNDYHTNEVMIFDQPSSSSSYKNNNNNPLQQLLVLNPGTTNEKSYSRTAHSEGEMFGLKFWENWYIIGENDKDSSEEFKFVYYNGKTRQNTYEGAFVYSRTKDLSPENMKKVYQIALDAGMNPDQFCRIRNGCFTDDDTLNNMIRKDSNNNGFLGSPNNPFRGILASTRVSELLGVEPVAARDMLRKTLPTAPVLTPDLTLSSNLKNNVPTATRHWWYEIGDYLENPHRHYAAMNQLRQPMIWPNDVVESSSSR